MATREIIKTGVVTLQYPKLLKPDTHGPKATGKYVTQFQPTEDETKALKAQLKKKAQELLPKIKSPKMPWKVDEDTGETTFRASSKYKPLVVDSKNNPVSEETRMGGGTKARLLLAINAYDGRISLYVNQAQIRELVEWTPKAEQSAFDAADDGWEADAPSPAFEADASASDADDENPFA